MSLIPITIAFLEVCKAIAPIIQKLLASDKNTIHYNLLTRKIVLDNTTNKYDNLSIKVTNNKTSIKYELCNNNQNPISVGFSSSVGSNNSQDCGNITIIDSNDSEDITDYLTNIESNNGYLNGSMTIYPAFSKSNDSEVNFSKIGAILLEKVLLNQTFLITVFGSGISILFGVSALKIYQAKQVRIGVDLRNEHASVFFGIDAKNDIKNDTDMIEIPYPIGIEINDGSIDSVKLTFTF